MTHLCLPINKRPYERYSHQNQHGKGSHNDPAVYRFGTSFHDFLKGSGASSGCESDENTARNVLHGKQERDRQAGLFIFETRNWKHSIKGKGFQIQHCDYPNRSLFSGTVYVPLKPPKRWLFLCWGTSMACTWPELRQRSAFHTVIEILPSFGTSASEVLKTA